MSNRNRNAGNAYERELVNELKELGFDVVTSRAESRNMDNKKVDVFSPEGTEENKIFPFFIQAKFTSSSPSYAKLLEEMPDNRPPLVFHRKSEPYKCKDGKTRHRSKGDFVILKKKDFYKLLNNGQYPTKDN